MGGKKRFTPEQLEARKRATQAEYLSRPDVVARRKARDAARVGNPEELAKRRDQVSRRYAKNWSAQKIKDIAIRARRLGYDFDIDESDIPLPEVCPIFGMPLVRVGGGQTNASPSVDRIDNSKGYVKGNVVVVSLKANAIKRDTTLAELKKMVEFYETLERLKRD